MSADDEVLGSMSERVRFAKVIHQPLRDLDVFRVLCRVPSQ